MIRNLLLAAALACAAPLVLALPALADAAVITAPAVTVTPAADTAVHIPYGQMIIDALQQLAPIVVDVLTAVVLWAVRSYVPIAGAFISQAVVQRIVQHAVDFGTNAVNGAVKDQQLDVQTGSAVIAAGVQHQIEALPGRLMKLVGGPQGLAEKIFRTLHLDANASASTVLAPALQQLGVATAAKA